MLVGDCLCLLLFFYYFHYFSLRFSTFHSHSTSRGATTVEMQPFFEENSILLLPEYPELPRKDQIEIQERVLEVDLRPTFLGGFPAAAVWKSLPELSSRLYMLVGGIHLPILTRAL